MDHAEPVRTPFWGLALAVAVGSAIAHLCTSALPFQIGTLIDGFGFSATSAGLIGFFQVGALAVSMILFAPFAHRFGAAVVCLFGMGLSAVANVLIYLTPAVLELLCLLAMLAGIGYGLILTAAIAGAAGSPTPDRVYAAGNSGSLLLVVAILAILPGLGAVFGARGVFLAVPLLIVAGLPFLFGFPKRRAHGLVEATAGAGFRNQLPLLAIWSLFSLGTGGMWAFVERVGTSLGLSGPVIGYVLSTSAFTGLLGTGLAALVINRMNRLTALAIGLIGGGATCLMFSIVTDVWTYAAAAVLYWIFTMFAYVLLLGTAAAIDRTGKLGTFGTGCERLAFAIGAPIGGILLDFGSPRSIGIGAAVVCAVVAPLFLPGLKRSLERASATQQAVNRSI